MHEARSEPRQSKAVQYSLTWQDRQGNPYSVEARGINASASGVGLECPKELREGGIVHVRAWDGSLDGDCEVIHCTQRGSKFLIGFEVREDVRGGEAPGQGQGSGYSHKHFSDRELDHYETLQISRKADLETIHRVFRIMAVRFHPDNPETGDMELFLRMKAAYDVLSDRQKRAEYDSNLESKREAGPRPIFALKDFVTGVEAESNRRLGVLSLLYDQRQTNPDHAGVSLLDLEKEMGFPREYLSFTMWYLHSLGYVEVADNSDYAISAGGVGYLEKEAVGNEIAGKLLFRGAQGAAAGAKAPRARTGNAVHAKHHIGPNPPLLTKAAN